MAGFQSTLQGGSPTATVNQKQPDTLGIDIASSLVKTAGDVIGSSYAIAQADKEYQNAFQTYQQTASNSSGLEDQLRAKTLEYRASNNSPELRKELSRLEDTVRKAKLGESAGVLSGLSMKSRIDGAYKSALSKFPAFSSELRAHRDSTVGGGAIGAALDKSKFEQEMAQRQAEKLSDEMGKYGLSYENEEDRVQFMTFAKYKGELESEYDIWLAKGAISRKSVADAQAKQTLEFGKAKEARAKGDYITRQAKETRAKEKYEYDVSQRGVKEDQARATYNKTLADIDRSEQTVAYNEQMNPIRVQEAKQKQSDRAENRKFTRFINKYSDDSSLTDFSEIITDMGNGTSITETLPKINQRRALAKTKLTNLMKSQGQLGSALHKSMASELDDTYDNMVTMVKDADPVAAAKQASQLRKYMQEEELLNDPEFKAMEYLKNTGKWQALQHYAKMEAEALAMPPGSAREVAKTEGKEFLAMYGLLPAQARKYLNMSIDAGEVIHPSAALPIAKAATDPNTDPNDPNQRILIDIAMNDNSTRLATMASSGGIDKARKNTLVRGTYNRAFDDKLHQTVSLLPSGYGIKYADRSWTIIKKGDESGEAYVRYLPQGDTADPTPGFNKWPGDFSRVARSDLEARFKMLDYITSNGSDIIKPTYELYNQGEQNKDALGTTEDLLKRGAEALLGAEDAEASEMLQFSGTEVAYPDGEIRRGGSKAWRNNNPGNITGMGGARYGAIGRAKTTTGDAGDQNQLVFATREDGERAFDQLVMDNYSTGSIEDEFKKYQTSKTGYRGKMGAMKKAGIDITKTIGDLTPEEYYEFKQIMFRFEGWEEGSVE